MTPLRLGFLVLTLAGIVYPVFLDESWVLGGPIFVFNWNMMIVWLAFLSYSGHESFVRKDYFPLVSWLVGLVFGLGAGLPLYLFLRSRALD